MRASLPASVRRLDIDVSNVWHFPRVDVDGGAGGDVWCGAKGKLTGLATGTAGLELCEACVAAALNYARQRFIESQGAKG